MPQLVRCNHPHLIATLCSDHWVGKMVIQAAYLLITKHSPVFFFITLYHIRKKKDMHSCAHTKDENHWTGGLTTLREKTFKLWLQKRQIWSELGWNVVTKHSGHRSILSRWRVKNHLQDPGPTLPPPKLRTLLKMVFLFLSFLLQLFRPFVFLRGSEINRFVLGPICIQSKP